MYISETAKAYDPESDMAVVVGVPSYYSEKSRTIIRFKCLPLFVRHFMYIVCWTSVILFAKLDLKC